MCRDARNISEKANDKIKISFRAEIIESYFTIKIQFYFLKFIISCAGLGCKIKVNCPYLRPGSTGESVFRGRTF